jgi:hypothetical protein
MNLATTPGLGNGSSRTHRGRRRARTRAPEAREEFVFPIALPPLRPLLWHANRICLSTKSRHGNRSLK